MYPHGHAPRGYPRTMGYMFPYGHAQHDRGYPSDRGYPLQRVQSSPAHHGGEGAGYARPQVMNHDNGMEQSFSAMKPASPKGLKPADATSYVDKDDPFARA